MAPLDTGLGLFSLHSFTSNEYYRLLCPHNSCSRRQTNLMHRVARAASHASLPLLCPIPAEISVLSLSPLITVLGWTLGFYMGQELYSAGIF